LYRNIKSEAAMHKNNGMVFRQHNIRLSRQFFIVQAVTESPAEKPAPQLHLRSGIPAANASHVVAAGLRAVYIGHGCVVLFVVEKECFQRLQTSFPAERSKASEAGNQRKNFKVLLSAEPAFEQQDKDEDTAFKMKQN